jgi:hypothetical protein
MIETLDPSTIEEEDLRQAVQDLMNVVDKQDVTIAELTAEMQRLRDEISRLKGEQGKPKIKANKPITDLSYGNNISMGISDTECHDASYGNNISMGISDTEYHDASYENPLPSCRPLQHSWKK